MTDTLKLYDCEFSSRFLLGTALYRSPEDIAHAKETADPLQILEQHLRADGVSEDELSSVWREAEAEVAAAEAAAFAGPDPVAAFSAKKPVHVELTHASR